MYNLLLLSKNIVIYFISLHRCPNDGPSLTYLVMFIFVYFVKCYPYRIIIKQCVRIKFSFWKWTMLHDLDASFNIYDNE